MLTPQEEATLKRIAHENMPSVVVNPQPPEPNFRAKTPDLVEEDLRRRPGKMKAFDPNDDPAVLHRLRHVLRPDETLMQFHVRTGLGRQQIMTMSKDEIARFIEIVERNSADDVQPPRATISQTYAPGTKPKAPRVVIVG